MRVLFRHSGKAQPSARSIECLDCAPGSVNQLSQQAACTPCEEGKYMNLTGAAVACIACPAGTKQTNRGQVLYALR